jgi:GNAT superfamily N-acetyltransferase
MAEVRHARPKDWERLKAIRLRALRDSPDAFCTTYDEAAALHDRVWIERSSTDPEEGASASFLALDGDEGVGLAVGVLCDDHRLDVVSVFVIPSYRGTGIAHELMDVVEDWGRRRGSCIAVLDVEASNRRAGSFYANLGYLPTGRRETYPTRMWLHRLELTKSLSDG